MMTRNSKSVQLNAVKPSLYRNDDEKEKTLKLMEKKPKNSVKCWGEIVKVSTNPAVYKKHSKTYVLLWFLSAVGLVIHLTYVLLQILCMVPLTTNLSRNF